MGADGQQAKGRKHENGSDNNGLGIAGFICSLIGLATCITAVPGIVLSAIALRREPRGFAIAGLVIGILAIPFSSLAIGIVLPAVGTARQAGRTIYTSSQVREIQYQAEVYAASEGGPQRSVRTMIDGGYLDLEFESDPYGTAYRLEQTEDGLIVSSAGPDGEFETEDDIRSADLESGDGSPGDSGSASEMTDEEFWEVFERARQAGERIRREQEGGG